MEDFYFHYYLFYFIQVLGALTLLKHFQRALHFSAGRHHVSVKTYYYNLSFKNGTSGSTLCKWTPVVVLLLKCSANNFQVSSYEGSYLILSIIDKTSEKELFTFKGFVNTAQIQLKKNRNQLEKTVHV